MDEKMVMTVQEAIDKGYKQQRDRQLTENAKTAGNNFFDSQDVIRRLGTIRSDVLKGISQGVNPLILLTRSCEGLGIATNEETYLPLVKKAIVKKYGEDALQPSLPNN